MTEIGNLIRERRLKLGLSMEKVARKANITYKSVLSLEHGNHATTKILLAVCEVLGLEVTLMTKMEGM